MVCHSVKIRNVRNNISQKQFFSDNPYMFNVSLDANNNKPIEINEIIEKVRNKKIELDHSIGGQP